MQAAFISYAVFTALFLLVILVVVIVVAVRSLLASIRGRHDRNKVIREEPPPHV
jgi:heme exporter protein D